MILGGDHSITEPNVRAVTAKHGAVGLVHFDTHTDTGTEVFDVELSHGTPMYRLVRDGHVIGSRYVQIGLRGYWPGEAEFAWQRDNGITSFFMHDVRELGIREVVDRAIAGVGDGPVFLTVDVDVLDPAFAPGTGTPEPGGMSRPTCSGRAASSPAGSSSSASTSSRCSRLRSAPRTSRPSSRTGSSARR